MRWIGIVGSEAAKFTPETEKAARAVIYALLDEPDVAGVVSGGCHLGGIDIWAEEAAIDLALDTQIHKPANLQWSTGYKPRNLAIARGCDECYCITVADLPEGYTGMRFPPLRGLQHNCYHCARHLGFNRKHVKSGGCWTVHQARKLGKKGELIVV